MSCVWTIKNIMTTPTLVGVTNAIIYVKFSVTDTDGEYSYTYTDEFWINSDNPINQLSWDTLPSHATIVTWLQDRLGMYRIADIESLVHGKLYHANISTLTTRAVPA